jgi:CheY-like chemotaxis protein
MPSPSAAKSILVVDDEPTILEVVSEALRCAGYSVFTATTKDGILRALTTRSFDLVITDLVMPEFDGMEVIRFVQDVQPEALIVAMTGGGEHISADSCLELGAGRGVRTVIRKPMRLDHLVHTVVQLLAETTQSEEGPAHIVLAPKPAPDATRRTD